ncbi:hypothetical protein HO133_004087 [Letharia lupina]|uniref:Rhodopsin domain-containing protein n=1 Tax=Letharia lupina TaxID=560253 RepID=A0A8H6F9G0_9LECA|nr:uncharacterized protein HO133_004087 [Letharia lupina]KAF6219618.1 hypothetical protein HO133_004087 [Letharia lupina]
MPSLLSSTEIEYELAHIHDNRAPNVVISAAICISLAITAVLLRLLARRLSKARILADDYMILFALIICMGQVAACLYSVHLGAGKHVILLKDPAAYAKTIIAMEVLYCIGTAAFKYSALLLFHRIFGSVPRFTAFLWCFAFVILANNIAEVFLSIFQCTPVHKAWDLNVEGSCVNILLAACIPGSLNVISDVVTFLLPIPLIWNLHMERNRKIQLVGIFLLSGLYVPHQRSLSLQSSQRHHADPANLTKASA